MQSQLSLHDFNEFKKQSLALGFSDQDADFVALSCWLQEYARLMLPEGLKPPPTPPELYVGYLQSRDNKAELFIATLTEVALNESQPSEIRALAPLNAANAVGIKATEILNATRAELFAKDASK